MMKKYNLFLFLMSIFIGVSFTKTAAEDKLKYLIITTDEYLNSKALREFIVFREKEFDIQIVTGKNIGTGTDDYRNYIRTKMPDYVLLVGKYGDFPTHKVYFRGIMAETYNYYTSSTLSGHPHPDIPLGLFFVENETELQNIVNKTIYTEDHLSSLPLTHYGHAGSIEPNGPFPTQICEEIITEINQKYLSPVGYSFSLTSAKDLIPDEIDLDIKAINNGVRFITYHGHANIQRWMLGLGVDNIKDLKNTVYPFIVSSSCLTGTFSGKIDEHQAECFAAKMVASAHGSVAFIGAYNSSSRGQNPMLNGLYHAIFKLGIVRYGDAFVYGINYNEMPDAVKKYYPIVTEEEKIWTAWQFHFFGDPAIKSMEMNLTGISDQINKSNNRLIVTPNPASSYIQIIKPDGITELNICNYLGKSVFFRQFNKFSSNNTSNEVRINISHLPLGMYIIKAGSLTAKFIIIKKNIS